MAAQDARLSPERAIALGGGLESVASHVGLWCLQQLGVIGDDERVVMTLDSAVHNHRQPTIWRADDVVPVERFQALISSARDSIETVDYASLMIVSEGSLRVLEGDPHIREVDQLQCLLKDGPAYHAVRTQRVCRIVSVSSSLEWPAVREVCRRCGVGSMGSVPVKLDRVSVGTLNLYSHDYHAIGPGETRSALRLAEQARDLIRAVMSSM